MICMYELLIYDGLFFLFLIQVDRSCDYVANRDVLILLAAFRIHKVYRVLDNGM